MTVAAVVIAALLGYPLPRFVWGAVFIDGIVAWATIILAWR